MNKTVVLVVEDDRPIRNLIVTTLKMHDYKYLTANNGVSAIMEESSRYCPLRSGSSGYGRSRCN